ncbi:GNAT family N-acetyltransferase [Anaeromicrobium sediminis]|uniref:GNAT family N-acetyltransferase n=1 Tax=Anaeromicrobium sediminis TaxID=1478221 RepID=A0A267MMK4_9FIRM|nr:GNAT family N-acetyltransferase [Anaeromicrobium sediminis]PAB60043.1 GNAT family N-acetyltransferase [Anaeromicrobium sediminis]
MSRLNIRNVLSNDLDCVCKIESLCFPAAEAASKKAFEERISVFPKGFFVAELDNEIIGFINGGVTNDIHIEDDFFKTMDLHIPDGDNIVIFGLDIHPDYQRKGYAKELMSHFIEDAKKSGRKKVLLTCKEHLIKYYEQFGYVNEGVSSSEHGGAKWYDMYLTV